MTKRVAGFALLAALVFGCQRMPSDKPPIHLNPNMDSQNKYKAQMQSDFFLNSASMRVPPEGTIARGELRADDALYRGKTSTGSELTHIPVPITKELMARGQERYNIYCTPCHGMTGAGDGIIVQRGFLPPPNFHAENVRNFTDGYLYDVIANGVRNMPSYAHQINVKDRWAIVAYVRALQRSQNASKDDLPEDKRREYGLQ